ncbi:hypothetical protein KJ359_008103 [Pestalotiopsis sp. 9143b]|nr:hypothetical protein KJ359_008103 [Pestalotiopsis sp. 9143b]
MCQGHTVRMRCGHHLNHYSIRCGRRCWDVCAICASARDDPRVRRCGRARRGERCERDRPSGPEHSLDDCCAGCDPAWRLYEARSLYEDRREQLERQRHADGPDDELDGILAALGAGYREACRDILDACPEPEGPGGVAFLPCVDMAQLGLDSRWVGKRCVWDDARDNSKQAQVVRRGDAEDEKDIDTSWQVELGWGSVPTNRSDSFVEEMEDEEFYDEDEEEEEEVQVEVQYREVDWFEMAELQIDEKKKPKSTPPIPQLIPELDKLPSLLPPGMEGHDKNLRKNQNQDVVQVTELQIVPRHLSQTWLGPRTRDWSSREMLFHAGKSSG